MMNLTHEKYRQALIEEIKDIKRQLNDYPDDLSDVLHRTLNVLWGVLEPETTEGKAAEEDTNEANMTLGDLFSALNPGVPFHRFVELLGMRKTDNARSKEDTK